MYAVSEGTKAVTKDTSSKYGNLAIKRSFSGPLHFLKERFLYILAQFDYIVLCHVLRIKCYVIVRYFNVHICH
jgi:hypothetical protein